jgi:hypothetical protein
MKNEANTVRLMVAPLVAPFDLDLCPWVPNVGDLAMNVFPTADGGASIPVRIVSGHPRLDDHFFVRCLGTPDAWLAPLSNLRPVL